MSLSSLPGIFRETNFTPPRKQGGSFSLYLNTNLPERHTRSASNQNGRSFPTFEASKKRSVSSSILKHRQTALSDQNNSAKNIAAHSKNQVIFNEEIKFWESNSGKRGKGPAVINISNVFYETSRKFNNRMIDLQEADSLKNTTELSLKEMVKVQSHFEQVTKTAHQIRFSFAAFVQESMRDLQTFQGKFFQKLKICYANLSKMRRQTNDQIKGNKKELQKVGNQLAVCQAVLSDLSQKGQQIVGQTIKVTKECVQSIGRDEMQYDFEEISEIPKTSRGGTGNVSKRTKYIELFSKNGQGRKSAQWDLGLQLGDLEIN